MKVVIIDDEPLISDKLKRIMETGLRGMHTVCAFADAQTALDYIEQEKPGVILTDIRMPGITGIELAKQINQMDYGAKIVFLTGYAEFEYARYGIEYKVFDYLLKPVDEQEAIKCINRAISAFHAEQKHTEMYQIFQDYFVKNQELIRQQFVEKLFFQPVIFSEKQMELQKQKLRIAINGYRVVAVTYDRNRMPLEEESYYSYIIHEFFLKKFKEILALEHGGIFYMIWPTEEKILWKFCSKLELIRRELAQLQPMDCMIAVSHYSENLSDIQQMKKEVLKCLEYGKDTGCMQLLSYQDLPMEYRENDFFDVTEAITELIRYLRSGNKKKILEQMQKIIDETEKETEKYFNNIMELIGANIFLFLSGIPLDKESKDKITESFEQQIHVQSERKTKADYMKYWLEYIADNIQSMHNNDQDQLIQQIYKYLNDNFSQPIGLTNVSEHVNRNPSYISRFIKQATGRKFSEILAELRLEEAKKLLRSSNLKITQIAEQVGYPNLQYFTRVFTGQMNMTPAEYRKITTYF